MGTTEEWEQELRLSRELSYLKLLQSYIHRERAVTLLEVARRAREDAVGLESAALNREASRLAEAIADEVPWSTDERIPDLSYLWRTSRAVRARSNHRPSDLDRSESNRYAYV